MVAAGCGVLRDTVGFMTKQIFFLFFLTEKVILVFNLCGHRFAKFTLCRTKREAREVSPEPMRGKVRKPGRNFPHTQAKCQGKRSLWLMPGQWPSKGYRQSLHHCSVKHALSLSSHLQQGGKVHVPCSSCPQSAWSIPGKPECKTNLYKLNHIS